MANMQALAERLQHGETVTFKGHGHSMTPHLKNGQEVTVRPVHEGEQFRKGMIVLAKVKGHIYLHFIKDVSQDRVLIGNAHGHMNGWTRYDKVFGVLT